MVAPEEDEGGEEEKGMAEANDPIDEESGGQGLYEHDRDGGGTEQVLADISEEEAVQIPLSGEQSEKQGGGEDEEMAVDREGADQLKPRKDEKKRDREGKDEKEPGGPHESEEASRLRKKMRQEQDAERKQRLLDEGLQEEATENPDDHLDPEGLGTADGSSERDEATQELKEEEIMNLGGIGGKAYTNTRDIEKRGANDQIDECENDDIGEGNNLGIGNDLQLGEVVMTTARLQWSKHRAATESHAMRLCEQLRLVLEPTLATRLQGDYRTGKRINMRRVVGYVASGFRKDKIWLRRTKPAKREYQVMVMIDNSSSMGEAGPIALSALATLSTALTRLEVGQLCVAAFASGVQMVHPFGQPFDDEAGAR